MLLLLTYQLPQLSMAVTDLLGTALIDPSAVNEEIGIFGGLSLFGLIVLFRVLSHTRQSFADVDPESDNVIMALWLVILVIHAVCAVLTIPAFFNAVPDFPGATGYQGMIGFIIYLFPIIFLISLILSAYGTIKSFTVKSRKSWGFKEALIIVIFIFAWIPIVGHFIDNGENLRNHSVYNTTWSGNSQFKDMVEGMGYEVYGIQSSLSALLRMNRSVCLVFFGPTQFYNPLADIPFFLELFKDPYTSMLICDDHGSTGMLMIDMFLSTLVTANPMPLGLFVNGILHDNASYDRAPWFPIIEDFESHPTTAGVSQVVLSKASAVLGGDLFSFFGWNAIGRTSVEYSWVDVNGDHMYKYENDNYPIPPILDDIIAGFGLNLSEGLPLGGYPQVTFAANEMSSGNRLFLSTDASLFNNELIGLYDNQVFGENIIEWLTNGNRSIAVVFDESHNIPRGTREFSSSAMFGLFQGYVNWLSTNPFLSWIYPLWALRTIRSWLPKEGDKKKKKKEEEKKSEELEDELKFRTSSFFAKKINWYRINKKYNQALIMLYRRVERKINKLMGVTNPTIENITNKISQERGKYFNATNLEKLTTFLQKMDDIKNDRITIADEQEFQDLFLDMGWVSDNI